MAILETQMFKNLWESMPPDPPRKLAPLTFVGAPPLLEILDLPLQLLADLSQNVKSVLPTYRLNQMKFKKQKRVILCTEEVTL